MYELEDVINDQDIELNTWCNSLMNSNNNMHHGAYSKTRSNKPWTWQHTARAADILINL